MGVLTFIGASFIPKTYITETRLMMVSGESGTSALAGLSALSGGMDILGKGGDGVDPLLLECLNAREIRYQMSTLFGLYTVHSESKPWDLIVKAINEDLEIYVDEATFVISVGYTGKDRNQNIGIARVIEINTAKIVTLLILINCSTREISFTRVLKLSASGFGSLDSKLFIIFL